MNEDEDYSGFGFDLPATAGSNIKGKHVPDDPDYPKYARGQLKGILDSMDVGVPVTEHQLETFVTGKGWKFSSQSFHAQVRNLRKPDNGGFCVTTDKTNKVVTYTLHGKHGAVAKCDKCGFAPYRRLDAQDAVSMYLALEDGHLEKSKKYMLDFLTRCGLAELVQEEKAEPIDLLGDDW